MSNLPAVADLPTLHATRDSWHALAEHVLAAARHRVNRRIGLRATPGGFGTPSFGDGEEVRVDGAALVVTRDGETVRHPITTVGAAADAVGIVPGAPTEVYAPATALDPDALLVIDPRAAVVLAAYLELGTELLQAFRASATADDAPSEVQLWPEHFDIGLELGNEARRARGTFGASTGDASHPLPYLYVTRWPGVADDPFWDDEAFPGASLDYRALAEAPDAAARGREFFRAARTVLTRHSS
jgi:hypothetical protein